MHTSNVTFHERVDRALHDDQLHVALQRATGKFTTLRAEALSSLENPDAVRDHARLIRAHTLSQLDRYLTQFAEQVEAAGGVVHWAPDAAACNRIVLEIAQKHGVKRVVKGKSMVSEETELNRDLIAAGLDVIESDWARRERVGLVQIRMFRPFPAARLRDMLAGVEKVAVIDRNCSFGHHGVFFQELKSALYGLPDARRPKAYGYVMGLGGRDIGVDAIEDVVRRTLARPTPDPETTWLGAVLPAAPAVPVPPAPESVR
jgi:hypothetical protein